MSGTGHDLRELIAPLAPLITLLASAAGALLAHAFARRRAASIEISISVAGLAAAAALAWRLWPGARAVEGLGLTADRLAMMGIVIVAAAACAAALVSPSYLSARGEKRGGYFSLLVLATLGMGVLVMASDLVTIVIAVETMSLALYALAGFMRDRPPSVEGALKYFIMGAFAAAFFCMGIAFLFGSLGSTDLGVMAERSAFVVSGEGRGAFLFGLAMLVAGLAFKVAAVPFHAWVPDAYDGAPTPVAMLLATGAKAAAVIAFLRLGLAIAGPGGAMWHHLSFGLSAATILWGNLAALKQDNLKRMLAYSSIAHAGTMLVAFPLLASAPVAMARAILIYVTAYAISTAGAFAAVSAIGLAPSEPVDIRHLSGLSRRKPALAFLLSLFLLSLAGFPPTLGFFGKYYLFMSAVGAGETALVVIAAAGTVVSFGYYLKPIVAIYFRKAPEVEVEPGPAVRHASYAPVVAVLAAAALAVIAFGLFPENLVEMVRASAQ